MVSGIVAINRVKRGFADVDALLDVLDRKLTHGTLQSDSRARISEILSLLPSDNEAGRELRAQIASVLVMTSPEYIVLR